MSYEFFTTDYFLFHHRGHGVSRSFSFFLCCHPEEHRDEGSRVHPLRKAALCSRDPSLSLWMTIGKKRISVELRVLRGE